MVRSDGERMRLASTANSASGMFAALLAGVCIYGAAGFALLLGALYVGTLMSEMVTIRFTPEAVERRGSTPCP